MPCSDRYAENDVDNNTRWRNTNSSTSNSISISRRGKVVLWQMKMSHTTNHTLLWYFYVAATMPGVNLPHKIRHACGCRLRKMLRFVGLRCTKTRYSLLFAVWCSFICLFCRLAPCRFDGMRSKRDEDKGGRTLRTSSGINAMLCNIEASEGSKYTIYTNSLIEVDSEILN